MNLIGLLFIALIFALIFWFLIQNYFSQSNCGNLYWAICQERIDIFFDIRHLCDHPTNTHCVNSVRIRGYSWSLFSCIRTRNSSVFGHFSRSDLPVKSSLLRGDSFSTYAKCVGKIHLGRVHIVGKKCRFFGKCCVRNKWIISYMGECGRMCLRMCQMVVK